MFYLIIFLRSWIRSRAKALAFMEACDTFLRSALIMPSMHLSVILLIDDSDANDSDVISIAHSVRSNNLSSPDILCS